MSDRGHHERPWNKSSRARAGGGGTPRIQSFFCTKTRGQNLAGQPACAAQVAAAGSFPGRKAGGALASEETRRDALPGSGSARSGTKKARDGLSGAGAGSRALSPRSPLCRQERAMHGRTQPTPPARLRAGSVRRRRGLLECRRHLVAAEPALPHSRCRLGLHLASGMGGGKRRALERPPPPRAFAEGPGLQGPAQTQCGKAGLVAGLGCGGEASLAGSWGCFFPCHHLLP